MAFCRFFWCVCHGIRVAGRFIVDISVAVGLLVLLPSLVLFVWIMALLERWWDGELDG
jgi:uncharacterized membrane protein